MVYALCAGLVVAQASVPREIAKARQAHIRETIRELTPRVAKLYGVSESKAIPFSIVSQKVAMQKLKEMAKASRRSSDERLGPGLALLHLMQRLKGHVGAGQHDYVLGGFYDPRAKMLYVLDDQPNAIKREILAHELAHAFQDQQMDLTRLWKIESLDERIALKAVIEGQAQVAAKKVLESDATARDLGAQKLPGSGIEMGSRGLDFMNFAYVAAAAFVTATATERDPLSLRLLRRPPVSSAQVLDAKL